MPQVTLHGWLPNGVAIDITQDDMPYADALAMANEWLARGMLTAPPVLENSERELIVTVMRRAKPADGTPIIDYYQEWKAFGSGKTFGEYKYCRKYLNNDGDVDKFLNASGFNSLEDIPLYDGQAALTRTYGVTHPKETAVPTPFYAVRKEGKEKTNSMGGKYNEWDLVGYEVAPQQPAQNAPESRQDASNSSAGEPTAQVRQPDPNWMRKPDSIVRFIAAAQKSFVLSHGQVIDALRYFSPDVIQGIDQYQDDDFHAWAACIAYACKYDPATIAAQEGIALGMKQLAIEMIELHETPF